MPGIDIIIGTLCKIIVHFIFVLLVNMVDIPCTSLVLLSSPDVPQCLVTKLGNAITLTVPERILCTHDAPYHIASLSPNLICNCLDRKLTDICFKEAKEMACPLRYFIVFCTSRII
jgi:hypothetical protein